LREINLTKIGQLKDGTAILWLSASRHAKRGRHVSAAIGPWKCHTYGAVQIRSAAGGQEGLADGGITNRVITSFQPRHRPLLNRTSYSSHSSHSSHNLDGRSLHAKMTHPGSVRPPRMFYCHPFHQAHFIGQSSPTLLSRHLGPVFSVREDRPCEYRKETTHQYECPGMRAMARMAICKRNMGDVHVDLVVCLR
jgi:hypothetical protein